MKPSRQPVSLEASVAEQTADDDNPYRAPLHDAEIELPLPPRFVQLNARATRLALSFGAVYIISAPAWSLVADIFTRPPRLHGTGAAVSTGLIAVCIAAVTSLLLAVLTAFIFQAVLEGNSLLSGEPYRELRRRLRLRARSHVVLLMGPTAAILLLPGASLVYFRMVTINSYLGGFTLSLVAPTLCAGVFAIREILRGRGVPREAVRR